jgi:hypothetical protein
VKWHILRISANFGGTPGKLSNPLVACHHAASSTASPGKAETEAASCSAIPTAAVMLLGVMRALGVTLTAHIETAG